MKVQAGLLFLVLVGCGETRDRGTSTNRPGDAGAMDAGGAVDGAALNDGGGPSDAGPQDGGTLSPTERACVDACYPEPIGTREACARACGTSSAVEAAALAFRCQDASMMWRLACDAQISVDYQACLASGMSESFCSRQSADDAQACITNQPVCPWP